MQIKEFTERHRKGTFLAAAGLAVASMLGVAVAQEHHAAANPLASVKIAEPTKGGDERGFSRVVKQALPAVVNIASSHTEKTATEGRSGRGQNQQGQNQQLDPFFRQFFGDDFQQRFQVPRNRIEKGLGSGVIVSPEGYILTNNHVIDKATDVTVTLRDKREFKAKVVGADPRTDIAVLKINGTDFPYLTLGSSAQVQVGDIALAIGNPFGVGQTVTMGIVSATGRSNLGIEEVEDFIQTDAPINPGNSGGALIDDQGHLIGINTAILSGQSGGNQGIGFAVPVDLAHNIMNQIMKNGKVDHGYLGVVPQNVTASMAKAFGATAATGALVADVSPNSPAAHANLKEGDIIIAVNGKAVEDANQLRLQVGFMAPGSTATLKIMRDGKPQDVQVTLGEFPSNAEKASLNTTEQGSPLEGVQVDNLTAEQAREMNLRPTTKGVVVSDVDPSSAAAEAGLRSGDVIQEVNHQAVQSVREFNNALTSAKKDSPVLLRVNREGTTLFVAV